MRTVVSEHTTSGHIPVLAQAVLELLAPAAGEVGVDCTVGRAGHAALICPGLSPGGSLVALDADPGNLEFARNVLANAAVPVTCVHANFASLRATLDRLGVGRVNLLLADLGFASNQMTDATRGLSFQNDGPLDMRLDPTASVTARDLVNRLPEKELADLIYQLGEERHSRRIAKKIVENRVRQPIETTMDLARLVRSANPQKHGDRIDPATRTFMALRIAVNGELDALDALLAALPGVMAPGGRAAIISFHSLEDRRVKQAFQGWASEGRAERLTRKPVVAQDIEARNNPRSRSAKLRAIRWRGDAGRDLNSALD